MFLSWKNEMAGEDWFISFIKYYDKFIIKYYNKFSIRKPEAISKPRATSFNRTNVELFYKNLEKNLYLVIILSPKIYGI